MITASKKEIVAAAPEPTREKMTNEAMISGGPQGDLMPATRRTSDWRVTVMQAIERTCAFLAAEPDLARLRVIEVYSAGPEAIAARDEMGGQVLRAALVSRPA